jgi:hypothetical protein
VDEATPPFARTFNRFAKADTNSHNNNGTLVFMKQTAGEVFSVGSITFGQSLAQGDATITPLVNTVLHRFSRPRFSDFDGNGIPDLLARNTLTHTLSLFSGAQGAGTLVPDPSGRGWGAYDQLLSIGDFDSDGFSDMIGRTSDGRMYLFCGNGGGSFCNSNNQYGVNSCPLASVVTATTRCTPANPVPQIDSGWSVISKLATVGDFDGDGVPDLLGVKGTGLYLFRGDGYGGFQQDGGTLINSVWNWSVSAFRDLIPIGDFNTDGYADLMVRSVAGGTTYMDLMVGGPPFTPGRPPSLTSYSDPADCLPSSRANYPPHSPPWAALLPRDVADPTKNAYAHPNCVCTMGVVSAAGSTPICHVDSGWGAFSKLIPVGNFAGSSPAVPALLGIGQSSPLAVGSLYLYKGWGNGSFQSGGVYQSGGWNQYDAVLGVW